MALISEANLTTLTDYLGNSHNSLYGGLGTNVYEADKGRNYINRGKVFVRGGSDVDGVDISFSVNSCLVSASAIPDADVSIPDESRYYIDNVLYTTSGVESYIFTLIDGCRLAPMSTGEAYRATVYIDTDGNLGAEKTCSFIYHSYCDYTSFNYPSVPAGTVEVANVLVRYGALAPTIQSTDITDSRHISGYLGLEDDDQMALFTSLNSDEDKLIATTLNFVSYYRSSVNSIRSHVVGFSGGLTFEAYYASRDYAFSENYRNLYKDIRSLELSQRMGFLSFSGVGSATGTSMLGDNRKLETAAQFEVYVPRYQSDGSTSYTIPVAWASTSASFDVYLVTSTTTTLTEPLPASLAATNIVVGSSASFSDSGYLIIDNELMAYSSKPDSTHIQLSARGIQQTGSIVRHGARSDIYEVEKQTVTVQASQTDTYNEAVAIGTSSNTYIQCAGISSTISGGVTDLMLGVRNKVS